MEAVTLNMPSIWQQVPALLEWSAVLALLFIFILKRILLFFAISFDKLRLSARLSILAFVLVLAWTPVPTILGDNIYDFWIPLLYYPRGFLGDLSVPTMALVLGVLVQEILRKDILSRQSYTCIFIYAAVLGSVFYPFALGLGAMDPYNFGFAAAGLASFLMWGNLLIFSLFLWGIRQYQLLTILLIAIGLHMSHWHESSNLWDYLIDAPLWFISLCLAIYRFVLWLKIRLHTQSFKNGGQV